MDSMLDNLSKTEFISICVRDPRLVKDDLWHAHVDYEIYLHTNSMCFRKKTSCVRRRYSEFVWLRHCLEQNALIIELPKLPPWNPFFSLRNKEQVSQRMKGMQEFLENVLQAPLSLSDSRLHLFLQSNLSITKIERCARGKTRYTVAEAIQRSNSGYIGRLEDKACCDSDCERSSSSSGLGVSVDTTLHRSSLRFFESSDRDPELLNCLSESQTPLIAP
ncbi:sorting nexin-10A [Dicentrarchus labrax]|uniref:Sorting nexin 10 n=1 Tax=Dicentrarchus labrax TaxID=13489 RepID=A0A8C4HPF1_DICLA|nr:sorting nexin-10A [Dicentrarchus labrax]XP_051247198.1 sorting nexin-10A [Dicentrarchus labrax]XP_051247199.1 sorting nexin-10A [Dicentrarchus labrax]XP_051247200.1 sorting nexin-10A [Dicentrarchus labrax]XP_051247201.1 sorting nexin-10A [Dicentrarchus labrax]